MIEQLMNAFADSDLDCQDWADDILRELAIVALECFNDIAKQQVIDADTIQAALNDAKASQ